MNPRSSSFLSSRGGPEREAVNRSQRILIDVFLSVCYSLDCIVPQGSCLGPLLFVIYATKCLRISFYTLTWTTDRFLWVLNLTATHIPRGCKWNDGMMECCIEKIRYWHLELWWSLGIGWSRADSLLMIIRPSSWLLELGSNFGNYRLWSSN